MAFSLTRLAHPVFLLVLGDQVAAGHDATGLNGVGGQGHARLLLNDLAPLFPGIALLDEAREGATMTRSRANLEQALARGDIPPVIEGDLIVLIHAGRNDFFGSPPVMRDASATRKAAAAVRKHLGRMISLLRTRYETPEHQVVVLVGNLIDPTDGTGVLGEDVPEGSDAALALLDDLALMNLELAREGEKRGALLLDAHAAFLGHGLRAADADRWISLEEDHAPLDAGHAVLHQLAWSTLQGEGD